MILNFENKKHGYEFLSSETDLKSYVTTITIICKLSPKGTIDLFIFFGRGNRMLVFLFFFVSFPLAFSEWFIILCKTNALNPMFFKDLSILLPLFLLFMHKPYIFKTKIQIIIDQFNSFISILKNRQNRKYQYQIAYLFALQHWEGMFFRFCFMEN